MYISDYCYAESLLISVLLYNLLENYDNSTTDNSFFIVCTSHLTQDPLQMAKNYDTVWDYYESTCSANDHTLILDLMEQNIVDRWCNQWLIY